MARLLRMAVAILVLVLTVVSVAGCGGGGGAARVETGRLALTVHWPEKSRLIPTAALSIKAVLTRGATVLGTQIVTQGDGWGNSETVFFDNLSPGDVVLTATAYPNRDATGVAQATGSAPATITSANTTQVTVTMATTIAHVEISPANPSIHAGGTVEMVATAKDAQGNTVLIDSNELHWTSGNTAAATVDLTTGQVTGVAAGQAVITAALMETGQVGSTTVTVNPPQPH